MSTAQTVRPNSNPDREVRLAWVFFGGTFVALILNGIWSMVVGTASPGGDESDLVQGWEGVLRNLPAYLLLVVVASLSVWFATQGGVHGSQRSKSALIASSLVLLFALSSVTRDAAEVVMTTRAATMAWATFGIDAVLVGLVFLAARQRIRHASVR
jgi:fumarate reductase subunit D